MYKEHIQRYHQIKTEIIKESPFFASILLSLRFGFNQCGTCYTDMKSIVFDPIFFSRLTNLELKICILHEVLHVVLKHCIRQRNRNHTLYNMACDIVVNSFLYDLYHKEYVDDVYLNHQHKGKEGYYYSAEEIYEDLLKENDYNYQVLDRHDVWDILCRDDDVPIINEAKLYSNHSFSRKLREVLESKYESKISWQEELHHFFNEKISDEDYSYSYRDVRFIDHIIPGLYDIYEEQLMDICIAVDVSASISINEYQLFINEINYLKDCFKLNAYICFFDTEVSKIEKIKYDQDIDYQVSGYGGTSFDNLFKSIKAYFDDLKLLIVFSDGYSSISESYEKDLLWVLTSDVELSVGKIIRFQ